MPKTFFFSKKLSYFLAIFLKKQFWQFLSKKASFCAFFFFYIQITILRRVRLWSIKYSFFKLAMLNSIVKISLIQKYTEKLIQISNLCESTRFQVNQSHKTHLCFFV